MISTRKWNGWIENKQVEFLIDQKLEFDGVTLVPCGPPKVYGRIIEGTKITVIDPVSRFGDEAIRKIVNEVSA